ncbi:MAG: CRISPR-associated protein Cas4 [Dehalococcoidia bacterium]
MMKLDTRDQRRDRREMPLMLTVSDVKQLGYCARIVYYGYLLGGRRPSTFKMSEGTRAHVDETRREARRSLRAYGLEGEASENARREFDVSLRSERLGLAGRLDLVIHAGKEVIPVDFKHGTAQPGRNHRYQLTAYALLVEEAWGKPVRRGFITLIPLKRSVPVPITATMREEVQRSITEIRGMIEREEMPPPTRMRERCRDCEFRRWCNDLDT